jgi:flavin-dependent thymidylate synthase
MDPKAEGPEFLGDQVSEYISKEVARWADVSMYRAEPDRLAEQGENVVPQVTLISMTPNPLRTMAATAELYAGRPVRSPGDVSRTTAMKWFGDMTRTALQAPLEFIDLHFFFEGVTRAFTHQLVRQRTAAYVQESQRFAVKENAAIEVAYPPSIMGLPEDHPWRMIWDSAISSVAYSYLRLVNAGMPAEDARGLLPTNITTRGHYKTNLRNLAEHAGMRLCSQAQAEWKQVWAGILRAIREYGPPSERWQQFAIAGLFKPVCYQTGKCEFLAETDRYCSIRERVMAHHKAGEGPEEWSDIDHAEPLREGAARLRPGSVS